jgi:DNA adenine methylase
MARIVSPLCYPGSKRQLFPVIKKFMEDNNINKPIFAESHCGGASVGLELLLNGYIEKLVLNDLDVAIISFWSSILENTTEFIHLLLTTPINIEEWKKQRKIYKSGKDILQNRNSLELGFATFYLNRTNFSGIIKGHARGGFKETYSMESRVNKIDLMNRIEKIAEFKDKIAIFGWYAESFIKHIDTKFDNVFIYIDPPYYRIGQRLYSQYYQEKDHIELEKCVRNIKNKWLLSYDKCDFIENLYKDYDIKETPFLYVANGINRKNELLISSKEI